MLHQASSDAARHGRPHHLAFARARRAHLLSECLSPSVGRCSLPSGLTAHLDLGVRPGDIHVFADYRAGCDLAVRLVRHDREAEPPDWHLPERWLLAI